MQKQDTYKISERIIGGTTVILVAMGQFNNTLFIPSLPHMSIPLGTSDSFLQLSVTLALFSFGFSQLIYGPLSDCYGRRKIALCGLVIFFLGNLLCTIAYTGTVFIIGKIIAGLGVGCVGPVARAIARDLSDGKSLVKLMGVLVMFMSITPAISPMLGGAIQGFLGWRFNFIALTLISFIVIVYIYITLPETNKFSGFNCNEFSIYKIFLNYCEMLLHGEFLIMALFNMLGYSAEVAFLLSSSYILQGEGVSPQVFGLISLAIVPCVILGNFLVTRFLYKLEVIHICLCGIILIALGSIIMAFFSKILPSSIILFIISMMVIALGEGILTPSSTARCMDLYGKKAGYAGAMTGAIAMIGSGLVIVEVSYYHVNNVIGLSGVLLFISSLLSLLYLASFFSIKRR